MGYTFKIGNLTETIETDDYGEYTSYNTDSVVLDDAPEFPNDELTGKSNSRSPSYTAWRDFCKSANIESVFYTESGHLICDHPGYMPITQEMIDIIHNRLEEYQQKATLPPGFDGFPSYDPISDTWISPDKGKYDPTLARLLWLEFWTKWAFQNCKNPAIENW